MSKSIYKTVFVLLLIVTAGGCKKSAAVTNVAKPQSSFRVTGYLLLSDIQAGNAANFDPGRITDLNIAFINPDANGDFAPLPVLNQLITTAHQQSVKVMASIGGGAAPAYYSVLLSDDMRAAFIKNLVQLTVDHQLDGIDVDLEGPRIDSNYEAFLVDLRSALKQHGKMLTAAIATAYAAQYTDKALAQLDFVNIMSYDKTGPWNPANPGQHAPYAMAVDDLGYWGNTRGIAKEKMSLGLPFYGYGFGPGAPADMTYSDIISQHPGAENADSVKVAGGGMVYYNGIPTITAKTTLALQNAGGVMIWQLLQDASGSKSLLSKIDATIQSAGK